MIKNLITAIGMTLIYTGQPLNRADTIDAENILITNPISKTNIYTQNIVDNNELTQSNEYAIIEYQEKNNGTIDIKNRALIITKRNFEDNEYYTNYYLLIEIDTSVNRENKPTYLTYDINQINTNTLYNSITLSYMQSWNTYQEDFINGKNYTEPEMIGLSLFLTNGGVQTETDTLRDRIEIETSDYKYLLVEIYVEYNPTYITDSGTSLTNNTNLISTLKYDIEFTLTIDPSQYEVIDIPGLMFEILGMPFAWFSIAFNFTLFPGTPYAINISHILLGLIVSLIAIVIFRIVMKGK